MKCECCGTREVTKAIKVEKDGRLQDLFVCDICGERYTSGKKKTIAPPKSGGIGPSGISSVTDVLMQLQPQQADMFAKLWGELARQITETGKNGKRRGMKCPVCGLTREMLVENRRFGCEECYKVFSDEVTLLLHELQVDDLHCGRKPARLTLAAQIDKLNENLKNALNEQRFEDAAAIRDELKTLTDKKNNSIEENSGGEEK